MELRFAGELWYWRGPSPFHFVSVPEEECEAIASVAPVVSYGWGMIPATVRVGQSEVATALWPRNGGYIVPLKSALRAAERLELGDTVELSLRIDA